jgi:hypothetical protein
MLKLLGELSVTNPLRACAKRFLSVACLALFLSTGAAFAQTSTFTYQGRLTDGGSSPTGTYDIEFKLYDALTSGNLQGSPNTVTYPTVSVTSGVFTVQLDFGASAFPGADRFLEISVRHPGDASYATLAPRLLLTAFVIRGLLDLRSHVRVAPRNAGKIVTWIVT